MSSSSDELVELIKLAQGNRSLNRFAKDCDINPGNLSRILRKITNNRPQAMTLRRIAENADNDVTIEDLMIAAGYMPAPPEPKEIELSEELEAPEITIDIDPTYVPLNDQDIILENEVEHFKNFLNSNKNKIILCDGSPLNPDILKNFIDSLEIELGFITPNPKKITIGD